MATIIKIERAITPFAPHFSILLSDSKSNWLDTNYGKLWKGLQLLCCNKYSNKTEQQRKFMNPGFCMDLALPIIRALSEIGNMNKKMKKIITAYVSCCLYFDIVD